MVSAARPGTVHVVLRRLGARVQRSAARRGTALSRRWRLLRAIAPEAWRLRRTGSPAGRRLSAALVRGALGREYADERPWVERIEAERRRIEQSRALVSWQAGVPTPVGTIARRASQPRSGGVLLLALVRAFAPQRGVEMGTCVGISAAYQAVGMRLNGHGELITLEGYGDLVEHARELWAGIGLDNITTRVGRFGQTLPGALEKPVDYAFIDGNHSETATLDYFERISRAATPGALLVFDDVAWSAGMARAWERIRLDARVAEHATAGRLGIVVLASRL